MQLTHSKYNEIKNKPLDEHIKNEAELHLQQLL